MTRQADYCNIAQSPSFGREADKVKQRNGAETRHGRAEMLEFVRSRRRFYALDYRHRPIVARDATDYTGRGPPTR